MILQIILLYFIIIELTTITEKMTQRQTSVEALRNEVNTKIAMRQNSMEHQAMKRRQYTQQASVLSKIWPYVSKRINIVIGVLVLSVLINLGLVLGFVFMIVKNNGHECSSAGAYPDQKESICLPCEFIKQGDTMLGAYVDSPYRYRNRNRQSSFDPYVHSPAERKDVCCMDARTALRILLDRMPAEQQRTLALQSTDPDCVTRVKKNETKRGENPSDARSATVAHMYLNTTSLTGELLKWQIGSTMAGVKSHDLVYDDGKLTIPTDGPFFVYSQLTFYSAPRRDTAPLVHNIVVERGRKMEILMQGKLELHPDNYRESYLGSVLQLRKGDKLFVSVSDSSYVFGYHLTNVFGLYRVGA